MKTTFSANRIDELAARLAPANEETGKRYPLGSGSRQPVHTVYGGAHLFKFDAAAKLGKIALRTLEEYGADPIDFSGALGLSPNPELSRTIHGRVIDKLKREPIEDFRIDFEDGYGNRPDEEEDGHAESAAKQTAKGIAEETLPPFLGIRVKPMSDELCRRGLRTLDIYVSTLLEASGGELPQNFVVTLPKITNVEQVRVFVGALAELEEKLGLAEGALPVEFMIETPHSIMSPDGRSNLPVLLDAAEGRCQSAHFGTYDYTALLDITAAHQEMTHPACDFAKHMMQVAYANRGIWLSDGATTIMPVPVHRPPKEGPGLTEEQREENRRAIYDAWRIHVRNIRHSLIHGFYQGWDLHPGQLPTRYAAVYAFFLEGLEPASRRLKSFVDAAAQATLVGDVFDDAATGQGLLNYFLRGLGCGALTEEEALATGLTLDELRSRSFLKILESRRQRA